MITCCCDVCAYTGITVAVSHDEIEGGTGLASVLIHRAAAVLKHLLAQVCTLLRLLFKQQISKLHAHTATHTDIYINNSGLYQQLATHTNK